MSVFLEMVDGFWVGLVEKVRSVVELVKCQLGEIIGVHDWEAFVGNIPREFWVTEEEGAGFCLIV